MGSIDESLDVLIVGAGPVGLALALDLGRRGIRSTIVERTPGTATELLAKASVIDERSMEFLRLLGVRDEIAHAGFPDDLPGDTVFCTSLSDKFIGRLVMPSTQQRELPPQSSEVLRRCPQFMFDPILARAVVRQGMATIRYGVQVSGCGQDDEGVTCVLTNVQDGKEEQIRARYVVGCDGPTSVIRRAVGIDWDGKNLGYAISVIVRVENLESLHDFGDRAERYMMISPEGTWANFTTLDGRNLWRFSVVGGQTKVDPATLDMPGLLRRAFGRDDVKYELMRVLQWRRSEYIAGKYCEGRVFLAGDSAHTMSPTGGHGLNTGLGDAMDLSWMLQALIQGWGGPGLIEAYNTERRPIAIRNGTGSTKNFALWTARQGRDKILDDGPEADEQRRALGDMMAKNMRQEFQSLGLALGYTYGDSPLIVPDGSPAPADGPEVYIQTSRPGHRAPHCWLKDGRSIIDLFGAGFVLLRFGEESSRVQYIVDAAQKLRIPLEIVSITEEEPAKLYERRLVLVRPDGMVAWRGDDLPDSVEELLHKVRGGVPAAVAK
ncbi:2,4-dichlorophenol 6-monooxygenase [Cytospora mali]|uniref:2,4-dichlorophenol 6-monooxygenase n=1 Tax=Cytospora mali TaxID=578113 RepID=A0A194UNL7_CYTMA|nr:2,4-dichlorophenol 6-monooxygenase [Valsa mali var. pyri (nom. inval.)]